MNNKVGWSILIGILLFIMGIFVIIYLQYNSIECNVGKMEVVGDYNFTGFFLNSKFNVQDKDCQVRDCLAFNEYQKAEKSCVHVGRCVVK